MISMGASEDSTIIAQTLPELTPDTGEALICFFPTPPHPRERLQSGDNLLSATEWPQVFG